MMAQVISIDCSKDVCTGFICQDCKQNDWKIFIYSLPKRVVTECQNCGGTYEMEVDD